MGTTSPMPRKNDVVGSKKDRVPASASDEPPSKMQGVEADESMEDASPNATLVAIEAFRHSSCELDHTVYDAIRSVHFVSAVDQHIRATSWDDLSGKPLVPELVKRALKKTVNLPSTKYTKRCQSLNFRTEPATRRSAHVGSMSTKETTTTPGTGRGLLPRNSTAANPPLEAKDVALTCGDRQRWHSYWLQGTRRSYFHACARMLVFVKCPQKTINQECVAD